MIDSVGPRTGIAGLAGCRESILIRHWRSASLSWCLRIAALISSGIVVFLQFALFLLLGTGLACYYKGMANPPEFSSNDQVLATFIVREMPVGLVGLTLAAVFSAAMSTLSSSLSSSAGAVVNDFLKTGRSSEQQMSASRWLTLVFGLIQIGVGIAASQMSQSVIGDALAIAGFSAGILLGVFALGAGTKHVGQRSAMVGMLLLALSTPLANS